MTTVTIQEKAEKVLKSAVRKLVQERKKQVSLSMFGERESHEDSCQSTLAQTRLTPFKS